METKNKTITKGNASIMNFVSEEASSIIQYNSSWDLLMPVMEKIESIGYRWEIGMSLKPPFHYCRIWSLPKIEGISPIDAVWGAVVEFIEWYNNK